MIDVVPLARYLALAAVIFVCGLGPAWVAVPRHWRADRLLFAPVFGLGALMLVGSSLNLLGMPMAQGGRLAVAILLAWGLHTIVTQRHPVVSAASRQALVIAGAVFAGSLVLWSVVWARAWNPYNDTYTYVAIADYVLGHSFRTPVDLDPRWPATTQVSLYQHGGFRMGANYFLALATSLFGAQRTFDYYLPVLGCGLFVLVFATTAMARRLFLLRRSDARRAGLLYGTHGGLVLSMALMGFLPQTLGMPIVMGYLTLQTALRGPRWSRAAGAGAAVLFGALVLVYLEVAAFAGLTAVALATAEVVRRHPLVLLTRWWSIALCAVIGLALVPVSAFNAPTALAIQAGVVVGLDPRLGVVDYLFVLGGLTPWWRHAALRPGALYTFGRAVALLLPLLGAWAWLRSPRVTYSRLGVTLGVAGVLTFLFAGAASNPFDPTTVGQPWSTLKIVSYYAWLPVLLVALGTGTLLRGPAYQRALGVVVLVGLAVAALGIAAGSAQWAARMMRDTVGSASPLDEYRQLPRLAGGRREGVNLLMSNEGLKHRQWVAYFLDVPVYTDWSDDVYIAPHLAPAQRRSEPRPGLPTLTYAPTAPGAVAAMVSASAMLSFGEGWHGAESDGQSHWRWLERRGALDLVVVDASQVTLVADLAVPFAGGRNITVSVDGPVAGRQTRTIDEQWFAPVEFGPFNLPAGTYRVSVEGSGEAGRLGPGDPRPISLGLRNPRVKTAPFVAAAAAAASPSPVASPASIEFGEGWHAPESDGASRWRWLEGKGTMTFTTTEPTMVRLAGELAVVGGARTVTLQFEGPSPARVTRRLPEQWFTAVEFTDLELSPGTYRVTIEADGEPARLGANDPRQVRLGLRNPTLMRRRPSPPAAVATGTR